MFRDEAPCVNRILHAANHPCHERIEAEVALFAKPEVPAGNVPWVPVAIKALVTQGFHELCTVVVQHFDQTLLRGPTSVNYDITPHVRVPPFLRRKVRLLDVATVIQAEPEPGNGRHGAWQKTHVARPTVHSNKGNGRFFFEVQWQEGESFGKRPCQQERSLAGRDPLPGTVPKRHLIMTEPLHLLKHLYLIWAELLVILSKPGAQGSQPHISTGLALSKCIVDCAWGLQTHPPHEEWVLPELGSNVLQVMGALNRNYQGNLPVCHEMAGNTTIHPVVVVPQVQRVQAHLRKGCTPNKHTHTYEQMHDAATVPHLGY